MKLYVASSWRNRELVSAVERQETFGIPILPAGSR